MWNQRHGGHFQVLVITESLFIMKENYDFLNKHGSKSTHFVLIIVTDFRNLRHVSLFLNEKKTDRQTRGPTMTQLIPNPVYFKFQLLSNSIYLNRKLPFHVNFYLTHASCKGEVNASAESIDPFQAAQSSWADIGRYLLLFLNFLHV